ncbi:hypothetical protein GB937_010888, partial [Aspergillus fischeri]
AAAIFGVPKSTFLDWLKGINLWSETRASGHKLTAIEEDVLSFCVEWHRLYFVNVPKMLLQSLELTRPPPLLNTVLNYVQDIIKGLHTSWFKAVHEAIQEHSIHEDDIWNFDETGFIMGLCTTSKVITAIERSERPRTVIQGNREWVTIIECISSKGLPIPLVVILKVKQHQAAWYQEPKLP